MDKAKKKRIKKYISWGAIALVVLILAVMPLMAKSEEEADGPRASILSGTVSTGSVSSAIHGGGTLEAGDAEDVTIPSGVKITEFLVKNGDVVAEGTPLASVDKVTVMTAITEVEDTLSYLKEEMEDARDETVSSYVSATAGGRVKAVYAEAGDDVQDVMLEHGALAVLSLDSLMAVNITRDMALSTGDTVCVSFSDGTEADGRVESNLNGEIVITVEDEGYAIGEPVTVTTDDGDRVGTGELYVHNAWTAAAYTGTISTVSAKEETTVSSGSTLFTLTDTEFTAQLEYLADQHREYEELLQELFQMYETGTINAPCEGMISGVDEDSTHLLAAEEEQWQAELLNARTEAGEGKGWQVILLSNVTQECLVGEDCPLDHDSLAHQEGCIKACDKSAQCDATVHYSGCIKSCDHADTADGCDATGEHYSDCIRSCVSAKEEDTCTASKHYPGCIESCISSDGKTDCPATGTHHTDCIESCDKTENCPATKYHYDTCVTRCDENLECDAVNHKENCPLNGVTYTAYAAKVTAVGESIVANADFSTVYTVTAGQNGWTLVEPTVLRTDLMINETIIASSASCSPGDIILVMTGTNSDGVVIVQNKVVVFQKAQQGSTGFPGMGDISGMMGGMGGLSGMGGMSGFGGMSGSYGGTVTTEVELFDLEGDVLMTVTPQETMTLTIMVDEQDISKISAGQAAEVKVTALKNQIFDAEVTEVAISGTNNGGSSKFTAELTMDMAENMLSGMSAAASIPLYTKMDVLTIPVAALVEDGAKTVVYTALDEETGEPASPVEVTIGVSDGENAEVLSGLESGDTFYYSYYDTLELSTAVEAEGFAFGR